MARVALLPASLLYSSNITCVIRTKSCVSRVWSRRAFTSLVSTNSSLPNESSQRSPEFATIGKPPRPSLPSSGWLTVPLTRLYGTSSSYRRHLLSVPPTRGICLPLTKHFGTSSSYQRHWFDTLKDDDDLDKRFNDPLYTKGATNPKPYEVELDLKAYRLEQEEKYRRLRPMVVFYVLVGSVCGYVASDSFIDAKKIQNNTRWMTPKVEEKIKPFLWASSITCFVNVIEFCEGCGSIGAHVPFCTLGAFAIVFGMKWIYRKAKDFLE